MEIGNEHIITTETDRIEVRHLFEMGANGCTCLDCADFTTILCKFATTFIEPSCYAQRLGIFSKKRRNKTEQLNIKCLKKTNARLMTN